ncbi:MAG: hypothetical protein Fur0042_11940 [Cyanophyceae cyanobacterium]
MATVVAMVTAPLMTPLALALALGSPMGAIAAVYGPGETTASPKQQPTTTEAPASCREIIEAAAFTGRTRCVFENGDRYDGSFTAGQLTGTGRYTYGAGGYYEGELRGGVFQGRGVFESAEGHRYEGDFVGGQFQGRGVYVTAGGDRYEGQFSNNTFDGQGTYTYADGRSLAGRWQAGQLVEPATDTIGTEGQEPTPEEEPSPSTTSENAPEGMPENPPEDRGTPGDAEPTPGNADGSSSRPRDGAAPDANIEAQPEAAGEITSTEGVLTSLGQPQGDQTAAVLEIAATEVRRSRLLDVRADALKPPMELP